MGVSTWATVQLVSQPHAGSDSERKGHRDIYDFKILKVRPSPTLSLDTS